MPTDLVAYSFVEPGGEPPKCRLQEVPSEINRYFDGHLEALKSRGRKGVSPPAKFLHQAARDRFLRLQSGSTAEFEVAAQQLADKLDSVTDHRMNRGFFVALRRAASDPVVGVLKLDVYDVPAAAVRRTPTGQAFFEAVQELLDLPGDLHKGAVFPDSRRNSELIVVDRFESQYFLKALEVRQLLSGARATRQFLREIEELAPERVEEVARALAEQRQPQSVRTFLNENPELLSTAQRRQILAEDKVKLRPVARLSGGPRLAVVTADGIRISGPAAEVDQKVSWRAFRGRWRTTIDTDEEPKKTYR